MGVSLLNFFDLKPLKRPINVNPPFFRDTLYVYVHSKCCHLDSLLTPSLDLGVEDTLVELEVERASPLILVTHNRRLTFIRLTFLTEMEIIQSDIEKPFMSKINNSNNFPPFLYLAN